MRIPPDGKNHINIKYLEETPINDLLLYAPEAEELNDRINRFSDSGIYGIIGEWGIGKSKLIDETKTFNQKFVEKHKHDRVGYHYKRIQFDAREFPERKDLWDGFILNFVGKISGNKDSTSKFLAKIDGRPGLSDKQKTFVNWGLPVLYIVLFLIYICFVFYENEVGAKIVGGGFLAIIGVFMSLSSFIFFINKDPAKRIIKYQIEFKKRLNNNIQSKQFAYHKIVVVLEDIDRSSEEGIFFLETLKNFFSKNNFGIPIVFLCPITDTSLRKDFQKYLKCFDDYAFFKGKFDIKLFLKEVFSEFNGELLDKEEEAFNLFSKIITKDNDYKKNLTPREMKYLLRLIYDRYIEISNKSGYPDLLVFFIVYMVNSEKIMDNSRYYLKVKSGNNQLWIGDNRGRSSYNKDFLSLLIKLGLIKETIDIKFFSGTIVIDGEGFKYKRINTHLLEEQQPFDLYIPDIYKP